MWCVCVTPVLVQRELELLCLPISGQWNTHSKRKWGFGWWLYALFLGHVQNNTNTHCFVCGLYCVIAFGIWSVCWNSCVVLCLKRQLCLSLGEEKRHVGRDMLYLCLSSHLSYLICWALSRVRVVDSDIKSSLGCPCKNCWTISAVPMHIAAVFDTHHCMSQTHGICSYMHSSFTKSANIFFHTHNSKQKNLVGVAEARSS